MSRPFLRPALVVVALAVVGVVTAPANAAIDFADIRFWAGTGANRAALVIDFNDAKSPESLVWGFRWDGAATGEDMFRAVVGSDGRLFAKRKVYTWGLANLGVGYDVNGNGFATSDGTAFDPQTGIAMGNENPSVSPTDPADHYREGWGTGLGSGYFAYYTAAANPYAPGGKWDESQVGGSDRALADGSWDGLSFAPEFATTLPDQPTAAVPEPAAGLLVLGGGIALAGRRPRRSSRDA